MNVITWFQPCSYVIIPITYRLQFYTNTFVPIMSNLQWVNNLSGIQDFTT